MADDKFAPVRERVVTDLMQACLDLANASTELFDRFEEHGIEAAWEGDGAVVVMKMQKAHEHLRSFLARQAARRLIALGVSPETLLREDDYTEAERVRDINESRAPGALA